MTPVNAAIKRLRSYYKKSFKEESLEYLELVLRNLYAEGQADGMKTINRIWEK